MASYLRSGLALAVTYLGDVLRGLDAIHRFELATPDEGIGVGLRVFLLF